jgi:hypothetical protein
VLVALTGNGRDEDRRQAIAAGFDYHVVKREPGRASRGRHADRDRCRAARAAHSRRAGQSDRSLSHPATTGRSHPACAPLPARRRRAILPPAHR